MFNEISAKDIKDNVFNMIGDKWLLLSAKKPDGTINAMTASWGAMGVMWGKDVVFAVIRPQRYTKEFFDSSDEFTVNVFSDGHKKMLGYMGSVSGRDEDKIAKCGLTVKGEGSPYFAECETAIVCKKLFAQELKKDSFLYNETIERWYPQEDFHTLYIGEIEKVLVKK